MKTIRIEKYVDGICQKQLKAPRVLVAFLARLLPARAKQDLQNRGLDLDALLDDKNKPHTTQCFEVREGKVDKRIKISV